MKCPACVEEGKTSRWYPPEWWDSTCMGFETYYDEEGKYHRHDPNSSWSNASCSNGHRFFVRSSSRCNNCDFGSKGKMTLDNEDKALRVDYYMNESGEWERELAAATG